MAMAVTMSSAAFNVAMALKTQLNFTFNTTSPLFIQRTKARLSLHLAFA